MLAYVDKNTVQVTKFEGNPHHPEVEVGIVLKDLLQLIKFRILSGYSTLFVELALEAKEGWEQISWEEALDEIAGENS